MAEISCFTLCVHRSEGQKTHGKQSTDLLDVNIFCKICLPVSRYFCTGMFSNNAVHC